MSNNPNKRPGMRAGPEAMAAAVAIAAGTVAYSEPVGFDNSDGEFEWRPAECAGEVWLDITLDAGQLGYNGPSSLSQLYYYGECYYPEVSGNFLSLDKYYGYGAVVSDGGHEWTIDRLEAGALIGPDAPFGYSNGALSVYRGPYQTFNDWGEVGAEGYIGVWFEKSERRHYGWILARLTDPRAQLEALAWGYESEPDTPIRAGDGLIDRCYADLDGNGTLNIFDFLTFVNLFNAGDLGADFDGDGALNLFDFLAFTNAFNAGC